MERNLKELTGETLIVELNKIMADMRQDIQKRNTYIQGLTNIQQEKQVKETNKSDLENKLKNEKPEQLRFISKSHIMTKVISIAIFIICMIVAGIIGFIILAANAERAPETSEIIMCVGAYVGSIVACFATGFILYKSFVDFFYLSGIIGRIIKSLVVSAIVLVVILLIVSAIIGTDSFIPVVVPFTAICIVAFGIVAYIIYKILDKIEYKKDYSAYLIEKEKFDITAEEECKKRKEDITKKIEEIEQDILTVDKKIEDYESKAPYLIDFPKELNMHNDYANLNTFEHFVDYIRRGKCDNIKECINKYDEDREKAKNQEQIDNLKRQMQENEEEIKRSNENAAILQAQINQNKAEMQAMGENLREDIKKSEEKASEATKVVTYTDEQEEKIKQIYNK